MAQFVEVTEEINNGTTNDTPITKSLNTHFLKSSQVNGTGAEVIMRGRGTMDSRIVSETNAAVLAAANAAPTSDVEKMLSLTVKKGPSGRTESTPFALSMAKINVTEFYADLQDNTDSIVIVSGDDNQAERRVYLVDETYAALKTAFDL